MKSQSSRHQPGERDVHPLHGIGELVVSGALLGQLFEHRTGVEPHAELPAELVQHVPDADVLGLAEYPVAALGVSYHLGGAAGGVQEGRVGASGQGAADLDVRDAMVDSDYRDLQVAGQRPSGGRGDAEAGAQARTHRERHEPHVAQGHPGLVQRLPDDAGDDVGVMVGGLPRMKAPLLRPEHVDLVGIHLAIGINDPDAQGVGSPLYPESDHRLTVPERTVNICRRRAKAKQATFI